MFGQLRTNEKGEVLDKHYASVYVRVTADHLADGCVLPRILHWVNEDDIESAV